MIHILVLENKIHHQLPHDSHFTYKMAAKVV